MNNLWKYIIIASSVVLSSIVLSAAVTQRYRANTGTITVTGLGETQFTSDLITIEGYIEVENFDAAEGYRALEQSRESVINFLTSKVERYARPRLRFAFQRRHGVESPPDG